MNHETTIDTLRELGSLMPKTSPYERMLLLMVATAGDPVQMGHVAKRVGITSGAVTTITDRLVKDSLIERVRLEEGDRRIVYVQPTKLGARIVARAEKATEVAA